MPEPVPEADEYLLGDSATEGRRLHTLAEDLAADSRRLLDQLKLQPGGRAVDLGCGPHGILDLLSARVGPGGKVVGVEQSEATAELARKFVAERRLANVDVLHGDAKATGLPRDSFDVVYSRLVLVNVPEPQRVVEEMVALARPGGAVASHEADWIGCMCDPASEAWTRLFEVFDAYSRLNGVDLFVGRKTHRMLRAAGVIDVRVNPLVHVCPQGHPRSTFFLEFMQNLRDRILTHRLISEDEFDRRIADLKRDLDQPGTLVYHLYFQAWGRKPG